MQLIEEATQEIISHVNKQLTENQLKSIVTEAHSIDLIVGSQCVQFFPSVLKPAKTRVEPDSKFTLRLSRMSQSELIGCVIFSHRLSPDFAVKAFRIQSLQLDVF